MNGTASIKGTYAISFRVTSWSTAIAGRLHPVDEWFGQKPCITYAGTEAIVIDDEWGHLLANNQHWTTEDVVRIRCLLRPSQAEIQEFLAKAASEGSPQNPAWQGPEKSVLRVRGCATGQSQPRFLTWSSMESPKSSAGRRHSSAQNGRFSHSVTTVGIRRKQSLDG